MNESKNVSEFIKTLGVKAIRAGTRCARSAPTNWKADGGIPPRYYPNFEILCRRVGLKCERRFFLFAAPVEAKVEK